jgi:Rrf2 family transcriptional regulator, nitric oxide-sensitive transcriptional repressor
MRLTFSTDYVLRLLMLVGLESDRLVSVEEGADRFGISKKVAYQLGQAGYLENARGRNGGLRLGKAPRQVVVGKVVRKIEPDFAVVECENPEDYCRIEPCCTLRSAMAEAVQAFLEKLDQYTLGLTQERMPRFAPYGVGQESLRIDCARVRRTGFL